MNTSKVTLKAESFSPRFDLRAGERVREYLSMELERPELKAGSRLPSIRQVATRLNVSIPTVQSVFRKFAKEGSIRTETGNGTFLMAPDNTSKRDLRIALNFQISETTHYDPWGWRISAGILRAATRFQHRVSVVPLSDDAPSHLPGASRQLIEERSYVDGLILFPCHDGKKIREAYERDGKPVVDLNPPFDSATANFVSPDYYQASFELGEALRSSGRRRALLLFKFNFGLKDSISARLRHVGFVSGFGVGLDEQTSLRLCELESHNEEDGYKAAQEILKKNFLPDVVYCSGDFIALGALRALHEHGLDVPQQVSVIGGTGLDLSASLFPRMTRLAQPLEKVGEELCSMLCWRIKNQAAPIPGRFLKNGFIGGSTTREEENSRLTNFQPQTPPLSRHKGSAV